MDMLWFWLAVLAACAKLVIIFVVILFWNILGIFYDIIVFLFENWIFQAAFGAWVVFALQQLHQASVHRADRFQKRYDQKFTAIQAFFTLVDKRIYATRAYRAALLSRDSQGAWKSERERYRDVVREWNERAPGVVVTLLTLLPARLCFQLEQETFQRFTAMDSCLARVRHAVENGHEDRISAIQVTNLLEELSAVSARSLAEFLNTAREEMRIIERKPTIDQKNEKNLSLGYLIASLFKPAIN